MSHDSVFLTIPPEDDSNQLPQLVYCFQVHNTLLPGYVSNEYAFGMALIDINVLAGPSSSGNYAGEIKAILYRDDVVYTSREVSQAEMEALQEENHRNFRLGGVDFTCHTVMLENLDMSIVDLVPTADLLQNSAMARNNGTAVLLITCACLVFPTWFILHHISVPVKQMVTDMRDIQAGIKKTLTLPKLSDLRYVAESVNRTLEVLETSNRRQQEMSHTLYQTTLAQKQAQLNAYKNQISPHFLFNTLESMRSMAHHYQVPILENMLTSLASLFRYSLRSSLVVSLREELNHAQHYFNVMDMRTPQRYELRVEVSQEALRHPLLSMVLQPLVENSITHGFRRKRRPCILLIQGRVNEENGILFLSVVDNGMGIPPEKLQELDQRSFQEGEALQNDHIGLDNVLHRLRLFYGEGFRFSLRSQENHYTAITLYIPKFPSEPSR